MIRKEAWPFYRTISGVRLCWELEEPKGPKGVLSVPTCRSSPLTQTAPEMWVPTDSWGLQGLEQPSRRAG